MLQTIHLNTHYNAKNHLLFNYANLSCWHNQGIQWNTFQRLFGWLATKVLCLFKTLNRTHILQKLISPAQKFKQNYYKAKVFIR